MVECFHRRIYLGEKMLDPRIDDLFEEIKNIKKKLQQIEQIIDNYHGDMSYSPFDRFKEIKEVKK